MSMRAPTLEAVAPWMRWALVAALLAPASPAIAKGPPQLVSLKPDTMDAGQTRTLEITGKDLGKVTALEFIPADGVSVGSLHKSKKALKAEVALAPGTPKGELRVVAVSPEGRSNELTLKIRATVDPSFVISNLAVGTVTKTKTAFGDGVAIPISVDFVDPSSAVGGESFRVNFDMAEGGVTGMTQQKPEGLNADQTSGTVSLSLELPLQFRESGAAVELKISLEAPEGRKSNELVASLTTP